MAVRHTSGASSVTVVGTHAQLEPDKNFCKRAFCNPSQSCSRECEIDESWAGMTHSFFGTVNSHLERKYLLLLSQILLNA